MVGNTNYPDMKARPKKSNRSVSIMDADVETLNKRLTNRIHHHIKEIHTMTRWGLFQGCKAGSIFCFKGSI
jgi:hypothetical protein